MRGLWLIEHTRFDPGYRVVEAHIADITEEQAAALHDEVNARPDQDLTVNLLPVLSFEELVDVLKGGTHADTPPSADATG